jgi:MYXO-CTERM domain-containing protein
VAATGNTSNGSGAGGATGEGATGGATTAAAHGASGGGCAVSARSPRDGMAAFLMLGVLALLVRRRQPGRPV